MVAFGTPKSRLFRDFRDFCDFCDFCDFSGFRKISGFPDFGGHVQKVRFLAPQNSTFEVPKVQDFGHSGHKFRTWIPVSTWTCVWCLYAHIFLCFLLAKKNGKIYLFGLNHLSNCWLLNAVGSLRPDSFQHVTCRR